MHKRLLNEALIEVTLQPDGPILVKAGDKGADPTLPDMEFVRTNGKPYLPGSSLKGVIRSHCERLARTVGGTELSCDPLHPKHSCSAELQKGGLSSEVIHARSCFVCRLFGNTALASRIYFTDAQPKGADPKTEERNGVAIDRVFGSVAVGPFNYETVIEGIFRGTFFVRNFGLAQLGLLALALRDVQQQRVRVGFGKSRGLGIVTLTVESLTIRYPTCELKNGEIRMLGVGRISDSPVVLGTGAFTGGEGYDFAPHDIASLPDGVHYGIDNWDTPEVCLKESHVPAFWRTCVGCWREEAERWTQRERRAS